MDKLFWSSSGVGRVSPRRRTAAALGWFGESVERAGEYEKGGGSDAACSPCLRGEKRGPVDAWNVEASRCRRRRALLLQRAAWARGVEDDKGEAGLGRGEREGGPCP
jgi:hypothetical protein